MYPRRLLSTVALVVVCVMQTSGEAHRYSLESTHTVVTGDTLYAIAESNDVTVEELMRWNQLTDDKIFPGQKLHVFRGIGSWTLYGVREGDNLYRIAQSHGMTVDALKEANSLTTDTIHPQQRLWVHGSDTQNTRHSENVRENTESSGFTMEMFFNVALRQSIPYGSDLYYFSKPEASTQLSDTYFEPSRFTADSSLGDAYANARYLMEQLDSLLDRANSSGSLVQSLRGWKIVLDPGHGGLDPGAIVPSTDGNNQTLYVCEDEYVYDIALRLYVLLKRRGAAVFLTVISPNHLMRHTIPSHRTLVNEKNEVFAQAEEDEMPTGDRDSLEKRVEIAHRFVGIVDGDSALREQTLFLSLHADNSPDAPNAPSLWYHERNGLADVTSKAVAEKMAETMGSGTFVRGSDFVVLRDNMFDTKLLIEVRNIAYQDHSWALRFEEHRQRDAERIADALVRALGSST